MSAAIIPFQRKAATIKRAPEEPTDGRLTYGSARATLAFIATMTANLIEFMDQQEKESGTPLERFSALLESVADEHGARRAVSPKRRAHKPKEGK